MAAKVNEAGAEHTAMVDTPAASSIFAVGAAADSPELKPLTEIQRGTEAARVLCQSNCCKNRDTSKYKRQELSLYEIIEMVKVGVAPK